MRFEWDERKRRANLAKHGLDSADVTEFDWENATWSEDKSENFGELRVRSIAPFRGKLAFIAWTERENGVFRIISFRPATAFEKKVYRDEFG